MKAKREYDIEKTESNFRPFGNWRSADFIIDRTNRAVVAKLYAPYDGGITSELNERRQYYVYNGNRGEINTAVHRAEPVLLVATNDRPVVGIAKADDMAEMAGEYLEELKQRAKLELYRRLRSDRGQSICNLRLWCYKLLDDLDDIEKSDRDLIRFVERGYED